MGTRQCQPHGRCRSGRVVADHRQTRRVPSRVDPGRPQTQQAAVRQAGEARLAVPGDPALESTSRDARLRRRLLDPLAQGSVRIQGGIKNHPHQPAPFLQGPHLVRSQAAQQDPDQLLSLIVRSGFAEVAGQDPSHSSKMAGRHPPHRVIAGQRGGDGPQFDDRPNIPIKPHHAAGPHLDNAQRSLPTMVRVESQPIGQSMLIVHTPDHTQARAAVASRLSPPRPLNPATSARVAPFLARPWTAARASASTYRRRRATASARIFARRTASPPVHTSYSQPRAEHTRAVHENTAATSGRHANFSGFTSTTRRRPSPIVTSTSGACRRATSPSRPLNHIGCAAIHTTIGSKSASHNRSNSRRLSYGTCPAERVNPRWPHRDGLIWLHHRVGVTRSPED